jgi:hypothetical protein
MPGYYAVGAQGVLTEPGHGIAPCPGDGIERILTVLVKIDEMPLRLARNRIPALVCIDGMPTDVVDVVLVETEKVRRERVHRQTIDLLMAFEPPGQKESRHTWYDDQRQNAGKNALHFGAL